MNGSMNSEVMFVSRADRRKGKKKNRYFRETAQQRVERIIRTGVVTAGDLKKEYDAGYRTAIKSTEEFIIPYFFAALSCALKSTFKFGEERIIRTISATISTMNEEITVMDMIDRCKRETGIDIIHHCKEEPFG